MPVSADTLLNQIEYSAWASGRLLQAAARLTDEELNGISGEDRAASAGSVEAPTE